MSCEAQSLLTLLALIFTSVGMTILVLAAWLRYEFRKQTAND